jgi:hypothetical protein
MTDLIKRLEEAKAGSADLDREVHFALGLVKRPRPGFSVNVPVVTTSLDAALALAERLFPGAEVYVGRQEGQWDADCEPVGCDRSAMFVDHKGATPALALCIAILKATDTGREA